MRTARLNLLRLTAALIAMLGVLVLGASTASAASVPGGTLTITRLSNGALKLNYGGRDYICYRGDLCLYRGGTFGAYYACQTISNSTTSVGWSVNNQVGTGGKALFYGRNGAANYTQPINTATRINWYYVSRVRICTG